MIKKRLHYNEANKTIEIIEEEQEENSKSKRDMVTFFISVLSLIISIGSLGISYFQKVATVKQADISIRQFNMNKKPVFECHIKKEELYDDEMYWECYRQWLNKNGIQNFNEWQLENFPGISDSYMDLNKSREFWDAYDNHDAEILEDLTGGVFATLENEYDNFIRSKEYMRYDSWKIFYVYEKDFITIKNTGAYITDAKLNVFSFLKYVLEIGDDISYSFVIDMNGLVLNEFWEGRYDNKWSYDSGKNESYIEYTQDILGSYEDEFLELNKLMEFLSSDILDVIGVNENEINAFYIIDRPVYFLINYLDNEQEEQTDWYRYSRESNTLSYIEAYDSSVILPDIKKEGLDDNYYEANALRVAEILGNQNAQWRPFVTLDEYSYIEKAKNRLLQI